MCPPQKIDYLTYLSTFDRVFEIPREKKNQDYKKQVTILIVVCLLLSLEGILKQWQTIFWTTSVELSHCWIRIRHVTFVQAQVLCCLAVYRTIWLRTKLFKDSLFLKHPETFVLQYQLIIATQLCIHINFTYHVACILWSMHKIIWWDFKVYYGVYMVKSCLAKSNMMSTIQRVVWRLACLCLLFNWFCLHLFTVPKISCDMTLEIVGTKMFLSQN